MAQWWNNNAYYINCNYATIRFRSWAWNEKSLICNVGIIYTFFPSSSQPELNCTMLTYPKLSAVMCQKELFEGNQQV